ncbi:hypothetical protein TIFTF001_044008 [Ficus carica]|uniref:glycerophosphodiester phosphodiesterase n=1 Tax=Ficus carica TaxID=3494 RepID=A0AA88CRB0_FICCA|nr:hypothetical protein TIFTF001_044008 [Ficus carica]
MKMKIKEKIGDAPKPSMDEIKKFEDAFTIPRSTSVKIGDFFTVELTDVIKEMHAANLCVYVNELKNEYVTLAFIYFSDPIVPPAQAPAAPLQVKDAVDPPFPPVGQPKSIWSPIHLLRQLSQTVWQKLQCCPFPSGNLGACSALFGFAFSLAEAERERGLAATMAATDRQPPHGEGQKLHFPAEESKWDV